MAEVRSAARRRRRPLGGREALCWRLADAPPGLELRRPASDFTDLESNAAYLAALEKLRRHRQRADRGGGAREEGADRRACSRPRDTPPWRPRAAFGPPAPMGFRETMATRKPRPRRMVTMEARADRRPTPMRRPGRVPADGPLRRAGRQARRGPAAGADPRGRAAAPRQMAFAAVDWHPVRSRGAISPGKISTGGPARGGGSHRGQAGARGLLARGAGPRDPPRRPPRRRDAGGKRTSAAPSSMARRLVGANLR